MASPTFKSVLSYSVQNEDYLTELAVLERLSSPQRILMIASSGENILSVLTQESVSQIEAIDINPAQIHLCELRRAMLEPLNRDEQLRLLGVAPNVHWEADAMTRLALYEQVRPHLPDATRLFWDENRQEIAFGLQHVGRNDVIMHDLKARLQEAGFKPLHQPLQETALPVWKGVYEALFTPSYIQAAFGLPSEALANRIATIAGYLGECTFRALQQPTPEQNPFLTTVFEQTYAPGEAGLPLYLQQQGQSALKRLGVQERLRLHIGNAIQAMMALAPFDLISISNIADWMTDEQFSTVVTQARDCLNPGGAFLARSANGNRMIMEVVEKHLHTDPS